MLSITILAKDINESNYYDSNNCAITKALIRAGKPTLKDVGNKIKDINTEEVLINSNNTEYNSLSNRVIGMYDYLGKVHGPTEYREEPKDFTVTLPID